MCGSQDQVPHTQHYPNITKARSPVRFRCPKQYLEDPESILVCFQSQTQRVFAQRMTEEPELIVLNKILSQLKKNKRAISFPDGKYFCENQIVKTCTDQNLMKARIQGLQGNIRIVSQTSTKTKSKCLSSSQVMRRKLILVFLPIGLRMSSKEYLDYVLKPHVKPWIEGNYPDNKCHVFIT